MTSPKAAKWLAAVLLLAGVYFAIASIGGSKVAPIFVVLCGYYAGLIIGRTITVTKETP